MPATPKRQLIRESVKSILVNANTSATTNVYSNRVSAYWKEELPSISIFMNDEQATPRNLQQKQYIRQATMRIEIHAEASEDLDDTLDSIADQVEAALDADLSLGATVTSCTLQSTDIEISGDSTKPLGVCSLTYSVQYLK